MGRIYQSVFALYLRITFIEAPVTFTKMIHVEWPKANMFHSIVFYKTQIWNFITYQSI